MGTYLDTILDAHRAAAAADERPLEELLHQAEGMAPTRPFAAALTDDDDLAVIAEVKRRSPSKGPLALDLDPASLAVSYQCGGAACLSVLTDEEFFGGSAADLAEARAACDLPVLRKDFTVDERDVVDARIMGADAVLLIVAALDDELLRRCLDRAASLGLAALVEVHGAAELARAAALGATLIGVNQRNLMTFEVDRSLAARLAKEIPAGAVTVAESGVRGAEDAVALAAAGYDAVLVGEMLVTSDDPGAAVIELRPGE